MNVLFLNIPFYKKYSGLENTNLNLYYKFFQEKKGNNPEIYNFQDYNGNCYGYISVKEGVVNISKINFKDDKSLLFNNCLVVWVCKSSKNDYNVIGWYKNASVFKYLQRKISYPTVGRDLYFNIKTKSKNAFLLNLEDRNFSLNIKFKNSSNVLIKNSTDPSIKSVLNFINTYNKQRLNIVYTESSFNEVLEYAPNNPILLAKRGSIFMYNENNFLEAIKFFNTALLYKESLNKQEILNIKYERTLCIQMLNCFDIAIKNFDEILNLANYNFNICKNLIYLYFLTENYKYVIKMCYEIIENELTNQENKLILEEIYCLKCEALIYQNKLSEGKDILNNIISNTESEKLKNHCLNILNKLIK